MLTFYSNPAKKQARIDRAKKHIEQDRLIAGCYQDGASNRGCSVGCDAIDISGKADEDCHRIVANEDGTPEWLEHLRDAIFEGLPESERANWHLHLAESIPVSVNIEKVKHQLADWMLSPSGPMPEAITHEIVKVAIEQVRKYHQDAIVGVFDSESAARSAAESAAWSAESAARSAWSAARSAARSAAWSTAESAESAAFESIANKTLELLRAA